MTAILLPNGKQQYFTTSGVPAVGYKLATFDAGTSNPRTTWQDAGKIAANTNPIILDARGEASIFWEGAYKVQLQDSTGAVIWTQDGLQSLQNGFGVTLLPAVTNTVDLGSAAISWRNIYLGPNNAPVLGASGNVGYYVRTAAEIALVVTPTDFSYPADPYVDPRRYGADATGVVDSTAALQTALNVAYQAGSTVWISGKFLTGPLALTMTGAANKPLRIFGSASIGSALIAKTGLAANSLLSFTTANPNTTAIEAFLVIDNIQIRSTAIVVGVQGLSLFGIAKWTMRNVRITGFDVGLDLQNTENHLCDSCEFVANRTGVRISLLGPFFLGMPTPTLQRFDNCVMNLNTSRGVDYNNGTGLYLIGCGIEGNGTAADTTTGGVFIGGQCSPDLGEGHVVIERCWLEGNKGWTINVAAQTNGTLLRTVIRGCELIGAESGREVLISGSWVVIMEDLASGSVGDTYNVTCQYGYLSQITVNVLTATGITYPFFSNVQTGVNFQYAGRIDSFTATLTGCTTSPTATVQVAQQGDEITLVIPDLLATSNLNTCTLLGLPAKYQPTASFIFLPIIVENNGTDTPQMALLSVGSGTITLYQGGSTTGFTSTPGSKGVRRQNLKYRLGL